MFLYLHNCYNWLANQVLHVDSLWRHWLMWHFVRASQTKCCCSLISVHSPMWDQLSFAVSTEEL